MSATLVCLEEVNFFVPTWSFWNAKAVIHINDALLFAGILPHLDLFTEEQNLQCLAMKENTGIFFSASCRVAYVPGQWWVLQCLVSLSFPVHCLPPFDGKGLVHVLVRYCDPVPHGLEQAHHFPHELQPPFTGNEKHKCTLVMSWYFPSTFDF